MHSHFSLFTIRFLVRQQAVSFGRVLQFHGHLMGHAEFSAQPVDLNRGPLANTLAGGECPVAEAVKANRQLLGQPFEPASQLLPKPFDPHRSRERRVNPLAPPAVALA